MKKLILKCGFSPGDLVMLTAAVRDLHSWYPGQYQTDVRTACPELWENNPHLTPLADDDPEAELIDCSYPLIDHCNKTPYHCLHGFIEFLNDKLGLKIKPTAFKGDLHLSAQEKAWFSQVHEVTREDTPFWIVAAGGKYDVTIKWWHTERYQQVVDHFRSRILFVQVGAYGHYHPRLQGVIDLRGRTNLRELIRLVYHAQGVVCSVTALMHLAAAVETKPGRPANRPCVVIAGGREPAHWEAYPDHQFIHTNGALPCCTAGGCWKDRTIRLR
ncbi:MAG TPA: glycosyltransferase family 9 protein, partial [Clostridia bacterium]|nr:glycosyltransferase family 9 protein [Clostridia bacterium]